MDDYISLCDAQDAMTAENLIRNLDDVENGESKRYARAAIRVLEQLETADVRPVVYCKDCRWYKEGEFLAPNRFCFRLKDNDGKPVGYNFADMDFCSYGERREGGADG